MNKLIVKPGLRTGEMSGNMAKEEILTGYDTSCIKSDVCNMAICDSNDCKHRFEIPKGMIADMLTSCDFIGDRCQSKALSERISNYATLLIKMGAK